MGFPIIACCFVKKLNMFKYYVGIINMFVFEQEHCNS